MRRRAALLALVTSLCWPVMALAQTLTVVGLDGQAKALSAADLAGLPRGTANLVEDGAPHAYEGPLMSAVLRAAGAPMGQRIHGDPLHAYVLATGADGFFAVYSLAELDKDFHDDVAVLADRVDGAPLPEKRQPWRLVSSGDKKGWRAVYQLTRIEIRAAKP